jgi:error-prone DNA polymerase
VDINHSTARFSVERVGVRATRPEGHWAIRIGLAQVAHVGEELAEAILWERRRAQAGDGSGAGPREANRGGKKDEERVQGGRCFTSLADLATRLRPHGLTWQAAEALVLVGACDHLRPAMECRQRLCQLRELWPLVGSAQPSGSRQSGRVRRRREQRTAEQLAFEWVVGEMGEMGLGQMVAEVPALPSLNAEERVVLEYQLLGLSARPHPMRLLRRELRRSGVRAITEVAEVAAGRVVRVAGWPISAQRPPTAHGMGFLVLEDETGRLPVALPPSLAARMYRVIRGSRAVMVARRVERVRWYRSLLALDVQGYDVQGYDRPRGA